LGTVNQYLGGSSDYVSYGLSVLSIDSSGHMMKFSQMNKLLCRFRLFEVDFGQLLNIFFEENAKKLDPRSPQSIRFIEEHTNGYRGKFTTQKAPLVTFDTQMISVLLYMIAWVIKFESFVILHLARTHNWITRF
jgi:hypothetical protein